MGTLTLPKIAIFSCRYFMNLIRFVLHTEISNFQTRIVPLLLLLSLSRPFIPGEGVHALDQYLGVGDRLRV